MAHVLCRIIGSLLEFPDTVAQALGQFGQLFAAEKDQHNGEDQHDFRTAHV